MVNQLPSVCSTSWCWVRYIAILGNPSCVYYFRIDKTTGKKCSSFCWPVGNTVKYDRPCGQHYILLSLVNLKKYDFVKSNRTKGLRRSKTYFKGTSVLSVLQPASSKAQKKVGFFFFKYKPHGWFPENPLVKLNPAGRKPLLRYIQAEKQSNKLGQVSLWLLSLACSRISSVIGCGAKVKWISSSCPT